MKAKKSIGFYLLGVLMVRSLKLYADKAACEELLWILKPTAWWAGILSGHSFIYEPGVGYVNHSLRFIIAPACAGLRFWMIASLMLICSFVHRMDSQRKKLCWTLLCLPFSCLATVFVNGIRIALSLALPQLLRALEQGKLLTQGQLHTAIGTAIYFLSLLLLFQMGDWTSRKLGGMVELQKELPLWIRIIPVLWYLGPILGLPLLSRIAYGDYENFTSYELPVLVVCGSILVAWGCLLMGNKFLCGIKHR